MDYNQFLKTIDGKKKYNDTYKSIIYDYGIWELPSEFWKKIFSGYNEKEILFWIKVNYKKKISITDIILIPFEINYLFEKILRKNKVDFENILEAAYLLRKQRSDCKNHKYILIILDRIFMIMKNKLFPEDKKEEFNNILYRYTN